MSNNRKAADARGNESAQLLMTVCNTFCTTDLSDAVFRPLQQCFVDHSSADSDDLLNIRQSESVLYHLSRLSWA